MVIRKKERKRSGPDCERLRRDTEVIIHQRSTREPIPFVSQLSVREGVSTLEILRGDENNSEEHKQHSKSK